VLSGDAPHTMAENVDMSDQLDSEPAKALTSDARILFEENMDNFVNDAENSENAISNHLKSQGIEPNLETILSHINGFMSGLIWYYYEVNYNKILNPDEQRDLSNLLKRRAFELRHSFISLRIME